MSPSKVKKPEVYLRLGWRGQGEKAVRDLFLADLQSRCLAGLSCDMG